MTWRFPVGLAAQLATVLAACQGGMGPGAETDPGYAQVPETWSGDVPAVVEPTIPVFDPARPRSPEERAAHVAKIKSGDDFVALELLPNVRVASPKVSNEITLVAGTGTMRVPLAGNEGLLALAPGEVLTGDRGNGKGAARAGINPFGFARKIVSTAVEGSDIVLETEPCRLTDLFAGAVQLEFDLTAAAPIDTTGIDLRDWFADWGEGYGPPEDPVEGGLFEKVSGAIGVDFTYTGDWGVKDKREFKVAVEQAVKGITLSAEGTLGLDVAVGFMPQISFGFDVHTPIDVWNSYLNYIRFKVGGTFYADAVLDAVLTIAAKASVGAAQLAAAKDTVKKGMPMPAAKSPKFKLGMLGPFAGPSLGPVPTTFLVEFVAGCEVTTYATITAQAEGHVRANASFGFEYDHDTNKLSFPLQTGFEKSTKFTFQSGEGGIVAECTFGPRVQWKIADIGGPYIDGHAGAVAELTYAAECKSPEKTPKSGPPPATLSGLVKVGFVVAFGGAIEIGKWGVTLWEYDFGTVDLVNEWWKLWESSWSAGTGLGSCASACEDGVRNYSEGGVDCGGYYCPKKCPAGSSCNLQSDCAPLNCTYGKCSTLNASDPCNDGSKGVGEIDVDCGGKCGKCKLGQKCGANEDCLSGLCPKMFGYTCAAFNCQNGIRDPAGESDVDCGLECAKSSLYCSDWSHCMTDNDCLKNDCLLVGYKDGKDKLYDVPTNDAQLLALQYCMPTPCVGMDNGVQDNNETDVDCGGSCLDYYDPPKNGSGKMKNAADLTEAERNQGYTSKNGVGKDFFRCRHLAGCQANRDCLSNWCNPETHLCGIPPCANGFRDFAEGDVDCGGPCLAKCDANRTCGKPSDCKNDSSGGPMSCTNWNFEVPGQFAGKKVCRPFHEDGVWQPALESDVDCGDKAPAKCAAGKRCGRPEYCQPGLVCTPDAFGGATCRVPGSCWDKKVTDRETDIDCGGSCNFWETCGPLCGACADGKACGADSDCKSKKCLGFVKQVLDPKSGSWVPGTLGTCMGTCENGLLNPEDGEGDVDCGGPKCAEKCRNNWTCKSNDQCKSGFCLAGKCTIAACDDGAASGAESDVDCGGNCLAKCAKGKKCVGSADCVSGTCKNKVCQGGMCDNGAVDPGEAATDCGAACSTKCPLDAACATGADCASGVCVNGLCACGPGKRPDPALAKCVVCGCSEPCGASQCTLGACANPSFADPTALPGSWPQGGVSADFNGDHVPDLAVAQGGNSVALYLGKGAGLFSPPSTWPAGLYPNSLAAADLNGDGRQDIVATNAGAGWSTKDSTVSVLLGNGDGTFTSKGDVAVGPNPGQVAIADLDGNGFPDLVVANDITAGYLAGTVTLLLGKGDGTFKPRSDLTPLAMPLQLGDVNGDGKLDIVANNGAGKLAVLPGNGNGTFQTRQTQSFGSWSFVLTDLNGDGRADIVRTTGEAALRVHLAATSGAAYAGAGTPYLLPAAPHRLLLGNLNGDGFPDLVATSAQPAGFMILPGTAGGAFGPVVSHQGLGSWHAGLADLDSNGWGDLFLPVSSQGETRIVLNPGAPTYHLDATGPTPRSLAVGDLNGDARIDLVTANGTGNGVSVLLGQDGAKLAAKVDYPTGRAPSAVAIGDLDGGGGLDLVVSYVDGQATGAGWVPKGGISVLKGNGDGTFQARKDFAADASFSHVAIGDLDGDGRADLAATLEKGNFVRVLRGDGAGGYPAHAQYRTDSQPSFVAVGDLNGDGRLDLAVASHHGGTVNVLLNAGDGTFKPSIDATVAPYPGEIAITDLDQDGRFDIVAASGHTFVVSVLLGRGDGTFRWKVDYPWASLGPTWTDPSLAVADLNGDGRVDVAVGRQAWKEIIVLPGAGDGTLGAPLPFRAPDGRASIAVADVNGDGHPDLATSNATGDRVSLLLGSCQDALLCANGKADPGESDVDCGTGCGATLCALGKKCGKAADCQSLLCLGGACAANPCADAQKAGAETDVDCGGGCPAKCAIGKGCITGKDCASGFCDGLTCVATACEDRLLSAGEADIDCGGGCTTRCATGSKCKAPADCASTFCDGAVCVPSACQDRKWSLGEGGVDCGGSCAAKCALGSLCKVDTDCASGSCDGALCVASPCSNKKKDASESDVDCGGACAATCSTGKTCGAGTDCASGICSATKRCVTSACDDGVLSGDETDSDCGGSCVTDCVPGAKCKAHGDCISGICSAFTKVCAVSACFNQVLDADETDVDCGGKCLVHCPNGQRCRADADCSSEACGHVSRVCVASWCLNERLDGDETDVDCGGSCKTGCATDRVCGTDGDCLSALCATLTHVCVSSHCYDQRRDQGETDTDCGGPCATDCALGQGCAAGADCASSVCSVAGKCVASTCLDGRLSGDETDVDCGGSCTSDCAAGRSCLGDGDCLSQMCAGQTRVCVTSSCLNETKDSSETDVDCGGGCPTDCRIGLGCAAATDCASGICSATSRCVATTCEDGRQGAGETDLDCGGGCPADCTTGRTCLVDGDCLSAACSAVSHLCVASPCLNQKKDGDESDVDCGGTCPDDCGLGAECLAGTDCVSGVCSIAGACVASTCLDGRLSGDETDTDCGGSCAADCSLGKGCQRDSDCATASCALLSGVCVTDACLDERKSQDETDVDCGGSCPADCGLGLGCSVAADCASGICSAAGRCVADPCQDGQKDGTETDVDCGGACPLACVAGRGCQTDGDCQSSACAAVSKVCASGPCGNEIKDDIETDVDCGGNCPLDCSNGLTCTGGWDCQSGICSSAGACVGSYCEDGRKAPSETDVDCGGSCTRDCQAGQGCLGEQDCASGLCANLSRICVVSTCEDELRSGDETDADCGGTCPTDCGLGRACAVGADCASAACSVAGLCVASTCEDGRRNGTETDLDCGGACPWDCQNGQACLADADCLTTLCASASKVCVGSTCADERKDGTETDVDCGGSCALNCADGLACASGADCVSNVCSVGLACVASTCLDGRLSGDESDVDCGGSCAADCATGKKCRADGDCTSAQCASGAKLCVASACQNQRKDANEADVDCGGVCGSRCANGAACLLDGDCASGVCSVANGCVATTCENGAQDGDEGGVDCGGSCPSACDPCTGVVCEATACRYAGVCEGGACSLGPAKPDGTACAAGKTCQGGACSTMIDNGNGTAVDPVSKLVWDKGVVVRSWENGLDTVCAGRGLPGSGWRAPSIDELRSLIRDCSVTVPGGQCNIAVGGCTAEACKDVLCNGCEPGVGPDAGCYWDPVMAGTCGAPYRIFSTTVRDGTTAWGIDGNYGSVAAVSRQPGQSSLLRCVTAHCTNGVKDGNETDLDCGGNCVGCADGDACGVDSDCTSGGCTGNVCAACPAGKAKSNGVCVDVATSGLNVSGIEQVQAGPVSLYVAPPGSLVVNGGAEAGDMTGWGWDGYPDWALVPQAAIPEATRGRPLFGAQGFVGPQGTSRLHQTVDLLAAGYTAEQIDAGIPLRAGFLARGYGRNGTDQVGLSIWFLDEWGGEVEAPFWSQYLGAQADVWGTSAAPATWATPALSVDWVPVGTRQIVVVMWSMDGEGWAGHWAAVVDGAHVVLGAQEMRIRNAGGAWAAWQPYALVVPGWVLPAGDGAKTVEVEFRDAAGVSLGAATDAVTVRQCQSVAACNNAGCSYAPRADGIPCDDGIAGNGTDVCKAGECVGCQDGDDCTDDSWVPGTGCLHVPVPDWTTACESETGVCFGGECIPW